MAFSKTDFTSPLSLHTRLVRRFLGNLLHELAKGRAGVGYDCRTSELLVSGSSGTVSIPLNLANNSRLLQDLNSYSETYSKSSFSGFLKKQDIQYLESKKKSISTE
jgi:hypothetical protein